MSTVQLQKRSAEVESEIASRKKAIEELSQRRQSNPSLSLEEMDRIMTELKGHEGKLENAQLLEMAIKKKIREYENNQPEAAKLTDQAKASWSQLVDVTAGIGAAVAQARKALAEGLSKAEQVTTEINSLAAKHLQLVGEPLRLPDWSLYARDYRRALDALGANNNSLEMPLAPWTYVSETERREAAAKQQADAKTAQAARVKIAIEQAPICKTCKHPMALRRDVGDDGEERPVGSGTWQFLHCFQTVTKKIPETVAR